MVKRAEDLNRDNVVWETEGEGTTEDPVKVVSAIDATVQDPVPINIDAIYKEDIDVENSDMGNFSGSITDVFDNLQSLIIDDTSNNPKILKVAFQNTMSSSTMGFGCDDLTKGFGSHITIKLLGSGEVVLKTVEHYPPTPNSSKADLGVAFFNGIIFEFNTADTVSVSNITIRKELETKSQIKAIKPDGTLTDIGATNNDNLRVSITEYGDTSAIDAFARLRTSDSYTIFDSKQLHDKQPLFWDEKLGGSGASAHSSVDAATTLSVTASASDYAIRQTKQRFNYQPGKGQLCYFSLLCTNQTGLIKRIGLFDGTGVNNLTPNNGIFFETGAGIRWRIAKNGSITETVAQANWNVDTLDGNGVSGVTLDLDAPQIAVIDYEWLSVGRVRVGFMIDGMPFYCHHFNHANDVTFSSAYMSSPNLPLRYSIEGDGVSTGSITQISATVMSEGGASQTGVLRGVYYGSSFLSVPSSGTTYALLGIRLKASYVDITVLPEHISLIAEQSQAEIPYLWTLNLNPTISSTFTYVDETYSAIQCAKGATANVVTDEGLVLDSGYLAGTNKGGSDLDRKFVTSLYMGSTIDGALDEIVLCVTPMDVSGSVAGSLTYRELL